MPRHSARSMGTPPRYPVEPKPAPAGLERIATAGVAALGLVGYLYALGGIVVWLRVQTAQLTPDGAIVAIDDRHLLAVGARVVAFELFLVVAISAIVTGLVGLGALRRGELPKTGTRKSQAFKEAWEEPGTLGGFIGPEAALLLITIGLSSDGSPALRMGLWLVGVAIAVPALLAMTFRVRPTRHADRHDGWRQYLQELGEAIGEDGLRTLAGLLFVAGVGVSVFLLPLLQGTILLAGTAMIYAGPLVSWPSTREFNALARELLVSSGVWTAIAVSTAIALAWVATPPVGFSSAQVEALNGSRSQVGAYLDRNDGGVYLGLCEARLAGSGQYEESDEAHIRFVPAAEAERLDLGQASYQFDPGGRPSLWQAVKAVVGGGSAATHNAPLPHPLRGRAAQVCGSGLERGVRPLGPAGN
jgi:hypothetical protein